MDTKLKWVIQDNLFNEDGYVRLMNSLDRLGQDYTVVKVVPFAHELIPDVDYPPDQKVIVMGSDALIRASQRKGWWPGAFTNDNFDHRAWVAAHGDEMLNYEADVIRFGDVKPPLDGDAFFIRPAIDFKIFAGEIITPENFLSWQSKAVAYGDTLNDDTEVVVAPYKKILQEYRFFVVDRKIVAGSSYKIGDRVTSSIDVDRDVLWYATGMLQTWHPAYAYVMDIARTPDGFKLIEYNCINGSGFYACPTTDIVSALSHMINDNEIGTLDGEQASRGILCAADHSRGIEI